MLSEDKRFRVTQTILGSSIYDFQVENELCESYDEDAYNTVVKLLNELHEENQKYKKVLEKIGLLKSDEEINNIREDIASKFLKPLLKQNGFDADINVEKGFDVHIKK